MFQPAALAADAQQKIFDLPGFLACGQSGSVVVPLTASALIPLPEGSRMFFLPDRSPVVLERASGQYTVLREYAAVAAFLPPGYTLSLTAAYEENKKAKLLPLYAYAPVAFYKGSFYVPAIRVDRRKVHDTHCLDKRALDRGIRTFEASSNRLIRHLIGCARTNFCANALNFFLGKYEAPLPTSPVCNASCLGCISFQPKGSCAAAQDRLTFVPTPGEVAEIALHHLRTVRRAIVSFGQGCEGEPLLSFAVIHEAIRMIRRETTRGTIHMNTNGSFPDRIDALCRDGLDSVRVSLNSAREEFYTRYYQPRGYGFSDVLDSIRMAKRRGKFVALNYLVMPGFTDSEDEFKALVSVIRLTKPDMIQWRNLNYDPRRYFQSLCVPPDVKAMGMPVFMRRLKEKFPSLKHGYFNMPLR